MKMNEKRELCSDIKHWLSWTLNFFLQLEMEDEDTIDVFQQQTGGSFL